VREKENKRELTYGNFVAIDGVIKDLGAGLKFLSWKYNAKRINL
jgi:hypothetical protein